MRGLLKRANTLNISPSYQLVGTTSFETTQDVIEVRRETPLPPQGHGDSKPQGSLTAPLLFLGAEPHAARRHQAGARVPNHQQGCAVHARFAAEEALQGGGRQRSALPLGHPAGGAGLQPGHTAVGAADC